MALEIRVNIGSGNGLLPNRQQAISWSNVDLLSLVPLETHLSEILIKIQSFSLKKMHLNMLST